jgi:hypothetical protein
MRRIDRAVDAMVSTAKLGLEVGAAWGLGKRTVGVFYGLSIQDVEKEYGGMAALAPTNCLGLEEFDAYISELKARA